MKITRQTSFANTAIVGNITYRMVGTYGVAIAVGILLFRTPVFKWNWAAMIAYIALASIIVGQTPTHRTMLANIYGILLKKPVRMVISDQATLNTMGHGVREVIFEDDLDAPAFKMGNGQYAMVYNVTSGLTQWSDEEDYHRQALRVKNLFNTFEGYESLQLVTKADADTGMLQLEEALAEQEVIGPEDDDLAEMAKNRRVLLHRVATQDVGRSVQQYAILKCKPRNVNRCLKALRKTARIIRPATNPGDVLLAAMGFEAGTEQHDEDFDNAALSVEELKNVGRRPATMPKQVDKKNPGRKLTKVGQIGRKKKTRKRGR